MNAESDASVADGEDAYGGGMGDRDAGPVAAEGAEDAEFAEVMADLQIQSLGYQAALAVTTRVAQPSLFDFLR